jgi:RHS repeat-associated protein
VRDTTRDVYTPYGAVTQHGADWSGNSIEGEFDGPLYCGYFFDRETGLYQDRSRYYDSSLAAFISRDPIGYKGGNNLYAYCGCNPINATDPMGTWEWPWSSNAQWWFGLSNPFAPSAPAAPVAQSAPATTPTYAPGINPQQIERFISEGMTPGGLVRQEAQEWANLFTSVVNVVPGIGNAAIYCANKLCTLDTPEPDPIPYIPYVPRPTGMFFTYPDQMEAFNQVKDDVVVGILTAKAMDMALPTRAAAPSVTRQPITDPARLLRGPQRPSWQQSEIDVAADLRGWQSQQSFMNGRAVDYGLEGSVRPDFSHATQPMHVDVKNYNLSGPLNRARLYSNLELQSLSRAQHLPSGSFQGVILDIRGQNLDPAVLQRIARNIEVVTGGRIRAQDVIFKKK